jgi:hypothetical protein
LIGIKKAVTSWNFRFIIISIATIGVLFDFDYVGKFDPPLQFFTIITNPTSAVFYLTLSLIAFRHSYKLMVFIAHKAPQMIFVLSITFGIMIIVSTMLIYFSFQFDWNTLNYPEEWKVMIGLEFVLLFWMLMTEAVLIKQWERKSH